MDGYEIAFFFNRFGEGEFCCLCKLLVFVLALYVACSAYYLICAFVCTQYRICSCLLQQHTFYIVKCVLPCIVKIPLDSLLRSINLSTLAVYDFVFVNSVVIIELVVIVIACKPPKHRELAVAHAPIDIIASRCARILRLLKIAIDVKFSMLTVFAFCVFLCTSEIAPSIHRFDKLSHS